MFAVQIAALGYGVCVQGMSLYRHYGHTASAHGPTLQINHFGDFSSLKICQKEARWPENPSPGSVLLFPLSTAWSCWLPFLLCKSPPSGVMPKSWTWSQRGRDQVFLKWFSLFVFPLLVSDIQPGNIPFVQLAAKLRLCRICSGNQESLNSNLSSCHQSYIVEQSFGLIIYVCDTDCILSSVQKALEFP